MQHGIMKTHANSPLQKGAFDGNDILKTTNTVVNWAGLTGSITYRNILGNRGDIFQTLEGSAA
jgi:hypothetical protein